MSILSKAMTIAAVINPKELLQGKSLVDSIAIFPFTNSETWCLVSQLVPLLARGGTLVLWAAVAVEFAPWVAITISHGRLVAAYYHLTCEPMGGCYRLL